MDFSEKTPFPKDPFFWTRDSVGVGPLTVLQQMGGIAAVSLVWDVVLKLKLGC